MDYLAIAYGLIAVVLIGYAVSLWQRLHAVKSEQARLETRDP